MTFEEYLSSLKGKTVGVIGVGVSNRPLIEKLLERGIDVTARDKKEDLGELGQALTAQGCKLRLGSGYLADLHEDVIFRTPGLRPDVPELAAAVAGGSVITSEMEAFFAVCPCPILAVTGSDGKTTTTTIISKLLAAEGKIVHVGGNIGHPLLCDTPAYSPLSCMRIQSPPYVCNVCQLRRGCVCDRAYYVATQAHAVAMRRYSESRSKPQTHGDELAALDKLVTPLIKKGQPLTHIYSTHRDKIPVSERTLYRYIDAGMLGVENLDLRRKVSYRQRRKQKKAIDTITNKKFRETRTYEDFLAYLTKHPGTNYVEMDTVLGTQGKGKRMLTMLFVQQSLMLIFLMRDGKANSVVEHFDWLTSALGLKTFRKLFPVILTDNGSEFKYTLEMERTIDGANRTKIFYCDPQAS